SLAHIWLHQAKICNLDVRCWIVHSHNPQDDYVRQLRIALLRLNASRVGLAAVVEGLVKKIAVTDPETEASNRLQNYLNKSAQRCLKIPLDFKDSDLLQVAYQSESVIIASSVIILLDMLKNEIDIRPQIFLKTKDTLSTVVNFCQINYGEVNSIVGDTYTANQVGAQGPNAHAHDMTFKQTLAGTDRTVDLLTLAGELERLRTELATNAKTPEQYVEIGAIAAAEKEAKNGDVEKTHEALSKAGKWSLGIAEKIGVGLATAVIKNSLGL
ncbi:MAG: hypothetical protein ABW202_23395, partial [Duganella sp.]